MVEKPSCILGCSLHLAHTQYWKPLTDYPLLFSTTCNILFYTPHITEPVGQVLVHWACAKISAGSDLPDSALHAALEEKLRGRSDIRYAAIAMHAQAVGRNSLATLLLELEPSASQQVHRSGSRV